MLLAVWRVACGHGQATAIEILHKRIRGRALVPVHAFQCLKSSYQVAKIKHKIIRLYYQYKMDY
jgi:hypothetical protein